MLFQADMGRQGPDDVRRTFWAERKEVEEDVRGFADDLFRTATDRTGDIDKLIEGHAEHWRMERMAAVDRNILRGAVAEFLGYPQTPRAVIINEAIEIARKFSSPESEQFINRVLDSAGRDLEKGRTGSQNALHRQLCLSSASHCLQQKSGLHGHQIRVARLRDVAAEARLFFVFFFWGGR